MILGDTHFGFLTLLPAIVAIFLAFRTKNVYISLLVGIYSGILLFNIFNLLIVKELPIYYLIIIIFASFLEIAQVLTNVLGDPWDAGIVLQVLFIGGLIHLITYSGGSKSMARAIAKNSKGQRSSQFLTWCMGLVVFFDDYANALIVGPIMRPIIDKMKISREKFAFIIDATAAPVAGLAIISTWIGYELGLIQAGLDQIGVHSSSFYIFVHSIPFRFYNILMLGFIVIGIVLSREYGPMYHVEKQARRGEKTPGFLNEVNNNKEELKEKEGIKSSIWDGILPIGTLIIGSLVLFYISGVTIIMNGTDKDLINIINNAPLSFLAIQMAFSNANAAIVLFQAALLALMVVFMRGAILKQFTVSEGFDVFMGGANSLLSTIFILLFAWGLGDIISSLGASNYMVSTLSNSIPAFILPAICFAMAGFIAFSTGTSFGTMGIMMPIIIPLAYAINPDMSYVTLSISSILTGATFGDHCSPISDTTILSSMGAGCDHIEHVRTQMPYALTVGFISFICYIFAALGLTNYLVLAIGFGSIFLVIRFVGKKVD